MNTQLHQVSRPLARPGPEEWRAYLRFLFWFCALFFPIYFGAGYLTDGSGRATAMYLPAEIAIPLVPSMIIVYLSLYSVFVLPLLHMSAADINTLSRQSTLALLIAGIGFVAIPGQLGFSPHIVEGWAKPAFDILLAINPPHNLVPSLHVTFAAMIFLAVIPHAPKPLAWLYGIWLALLSLSTLLAHQHHLIDVATGFMLAAFARAVFPNADELMPAKPGDA